MEKQVCAPLVGASHLGDLKKENKKKFSRAFSLIELMISLIVISIVAAAFTPVITKKLTKNTLIAGATAISTIRSDCEEFSKSGGTCNSCFENTCISCTFDDCDGYLNVGKCQCESCTLRSENCIQCNSKACKKCKENYYLDSNSKCQSCPSGKYCDGSSSPKDCANSISNCAACTTLSSCTKCKTEYYLNSSKTTCTKCEAGYFCDGTTEKHSCTGKTYSLAGAISCSNSTNVENCATYYNDKNGCKTCSNGYYFSSGKCLPCPAGYACSNNNKTACTGTTYSTGNASSCLSSSNSANCTTIDNTTGKCSKCNNGYYLNNGACTYCPAGYYCTNNSKTACSGTSYSTGGASSCSTSTNTANCTTINNSTGACTKCNTGYKISGSACVPEFSCSGQYFMKVGNYCITKYNMGDSTETAIPTSAGVTVVGTGQTCGSSSNYSTKCCWQGSTSGSSCDATNGNYSGCNRTVCNWAAANAICANYKKGDKSWRLPTTSEMSNWLTNSKSKGNNGLMLCDYYSGYSSAYCDYSYSCPGSYGGNCSPGIVWSGSFYSSTYAYNYYLSQGSWNKTINYRTGAFSVRCLQDI